VRNVRKEFIEFSLASSRGTCRKRAKIRRYFRYPDYKETGAVGASVQRCHTGNRALPDDGALNARIHTVPWRDEVLPDRTEAGKKRLSRSWIAISTAILFYVESFRIDCR
jgi:hypothetical protein